jgi:TRAP-type C4-dicarboxylate transport system permease small subunit
VIVRFHSFIEGVYDNQRLHSALGYLPQNEFDGVFSMDYFLKSVSRIAEGADKIAWVAVVGMMGLVVANCILRRFGYPVYGTYDVVCFLLVLVVVPALAHCAAQKGHIYLSILTDRFPQKVQLVIELIVYIISFIFFVLVTWQLGERATGTMHTGLLGMTSRIPVYPFIYFESLAVLILSLVFLRDIIEIVKEIRSID